MRSSIGKIDMVAFNDNEELRGISACTFCIQYDWEEKKCKLGCYKKEKETDYFCKDCPLPIVKKVEK